jgi:hypothetical protein
MEDPYVEPPYWAVIQVTEFELLFLPCEGRDIDEDGTALHYAWETWEIVEWEWANTVERCHLCALPFLADDFEGLQFGVHNLCAQLENRWDDGEDGDGFWRPNPLWPY